MCGNGHTRENQLQSQLSGFQATFDAYLQWEDLQPGDLPSLIAIYAPTPSGLSQYISVFILVYRVQVQMSRASFPQIKMVQREGNHADYLLYPPRPKLCRLHPLILLWKEFCHWFEDCSVKATFSLYPVHCFIYTALFLPHVLTTCAILERSLRLIKTRTTQSSNSAEDPQRV